ncbi:hypothetical protein GDO86_012001 [Hymenochirus boettgeri]|uniref:C2H2-type domain-containing protein n=1 Tax=Hymenochirus boettgeri TaxID=247094 RepID=A0A8T2JLN6_9PIPI|nr:hypothetical protein GDO86_012001 [Hymenochirus boettgeri]
MDQVGKSEDSEPAIKAERQSPVPCNPVRPVEISSSQERGSGLPCQQCGTCCNNQCGLNFQWNAQRMFHGSPTDRTQGNRYVTPPPIYFSTNTTSPSYGNNANGMAHPTSPVPSYGNATMGPLSPHCPPGYRVVDPSSHFTGPERPGNLAFGNFEPSAQHPLGPPGNDHANLELENRNRREQFLRDHPFPLHVPPYQDRRGNGTPCARCGAFCNNQCGMNMNNVLQWEQKRMLQAAPAAMEGNRYTSPPNPYFNSNASSSHFVNGRPGMRFTNPTVGNLGNAGMGQVAAQFAGYRKPVDQNVPNASRGRPENFTGMVPLSTGNVGSNGVSGSHCTNQGNRLSAANSGNQRRNQAVSAMTTIETMAANGSTGAALEQRLRHSLPTTTSSESPRDKSAVPPSMNRKPDGWRFTMQGSNQISRGVPPVPQQQFTRTLPQRIGEASNNKNSVAKNGIQTCPTVSGQEVGRVEISSHSSDNGIKRPASLMSSDGAQALKRASPLSINKDGPGGKRMTPPTAINSPSSTNPTPSIAKPANRVSPIIVVSENDDDFKKTVATETKDGRPIRESTPPITISNIRSGGICLSPPPTAKNNEASTSPPEIIIIDDKDPKESSPPRGSENSTNKEVRGSVEGSSASNPKGTEDNSVASSLPTTPNVPQGGPVLLNKVQVQQPSPIIVAGSSGNASLPVSVNGNQSIMLTFPVTMGSSGIMLATPVNIGERQITGVKQVNRVPIGNNTRIVSSHNVPLNIQPGTGNAKFAPVTLTSLLGQTNHIPLQSSQPKQITVNVNPQAANIASNLNVKSNNLTQLKSGTINTVPVKSHGNQGIGQAIPLFVDPNSGIILATPAVASKDAVPSGIGNATVVTVNGNVTPVTLGGKISFSNIAPVNVNRGLGIGNATTFIAVDGTLGIGNRAPVTLTNNVSSINNKGALSINNPTILTVNGGLGIGNAPLGNITPVNTTGTLHVGQTSTSAVINADQQNTGIVIRKVNDTDDGKAQQTLVKPDRTPITLDRLFKCCHCEESFASLETLTSHQKVHKEVKSIAESSQPSSKGPEDTEDPSVVRDDDAPKILYTTQGDDGSTVYVVTV